VETLLGADTLFIENRSTAGEATVALTLTGDASPVTSNGSIAVLTFKALEAGTTQVNIDRLQLLGGNGGVQQLAGKARAIPVRVIAKRQALFLFSGLVLE